MKSVSRAAACLALSGAAVMAQSVISARSGMIHYVEGSVFLADKQVESKFGSFPEIKENATLRTELGRAEVLLTPGVFLRVGENSSFRMVTDRLVDTRLEFLSGSAVVEADDLMKDNSVTVVYKDQAIHVAKKGLYRFDASPATLRVFDGEATVTAGDKTMEVKEGKSLTLDGNLQVAKFDKSQTDALDRWSRRRGEYVAMANVSAANSLRSRGISLSSGSWVWNPYFGLATFIPMNGWGYSPYGFAFWSPFTVYRMYQPIYYGPGYGRGGAPSSGYTARSGGYNTGAIPPTHGGYSGRVASAPISAPAGHAPSSAVAAPAAPVAHAGGGGNIGGGGAARR